MIRLTFSLTTLLAIGLVSGAVADDWLQFRGTGTDGVATNANPPAEVSEENIAWAVDLPGRGVSSPIVVGDRVFLTASSGYREETLHVFAFDAKTGKQLWERRFRATGRTMVHNKMAVATPTPTSDGQHIVAFFSSNDMACLDTDGMLLWYRGLTYDYPNASNSLGMSSSPVIVGNTVVAQVEADAEAFAVGLDINTGVEKWKIDRPRKANWTSPAVLNTDGESYVVLQSSAGLEVVTPATGKTVALFDDGASTIPSSTVSGGYIFTPSNGVTALKLTDDKKLEEVWNESRLQPSTPSPVVIDGKVYTLNRAGALTCGDVETGERLWQLRTKGPYSGTPVAAGGRLYLVNESGLLQVIGLKAGDERGEILDTHELGGTILCTPAVSGNAMFIRSDEKLWKIK